MFISPCNLRSTQCAALIALAAVAGIARVEMTRPTPVSGQDSASTTQTRSGSRPLDRLVGCATPAWSAPWLHPVATVALWFFSGIDTRAAADPTLTSAPALPSASHIAPAPAATATYLPDDALAASSLAHPAAPRPALCTRAHLIPFAVGPPAHALNLHPRPVGTAVPANDTVRCLSAPPSAFPFSCFAARLACPKFSGPTSVGLSFSPSSALRGEPAWLSASHTVPPSLGASARPGHDPFHVLT